MSYFMGVDGRTRTLRLCIVNDDSKQVALIERKEDCKPTDIGYSLASELIRSAAESTIQHANIPLDEVVSISVALEGIDPEKSADWLCGIFSDTCPQAMVVPSSIPEITLVGGRGERLGVLLQAAFHSLAYGVNQTGESVVVGGWGHLIGDEGSEHWLGVQALRAVARATDQRGISTQLSKRLLHHIGITHPGQLRHWLDNGAVVSHADITELVPVIFDCAEQGDEVAVRLVDQAASHLGAHYRAAALQLQLHEPPVVLDGRWLTTDSLLKGAVLKQLGLRREPARKHDAVMGAALLAQLVYRQETPA